MIDLGQQDVTFMKLPKISFDFLRKKSHPDKPSEIMTQNQGKAVKEVEATPAAGRTLTIGKWQLSVKTLILTAIGAAVLVLAGLGAHMAYSVFVAPQTLFNKAVPTLKPIETPAVTTAPGETPDIDPTPTPDVDPYEYALSIADTDMMKDIVNVLVIGVDYADERSTWSKNFYSDVMLVLAINFEEKTVDMISVPRDTYAKIANIEGIYKLNSSVHHGGGVPDGFPNVCESVSGVLGGIPIDYYVGVTMPVVKALVNEVGGVDFDVDVTINLQGRHIDPGYQHMDGQMVLDYLRARKGIDNDLGRVNRQKKMLVALFQKMQEEKSILDAPSLVMKYKDQLYTNLNSSQLAALAVFAYNLDSENISMHTMEGRFMDIFNWAFIITDQEKRVALIKEVYGIDVPEQVEYSLDYCVWMWADKEGRGFLHIANEVLEKDDSATTRKIAWEDRIKIQQAMDALSAELEAQEGVSNAKKKGDDLRDAVNNLEAVAGPIFSAAGYSVRWYVAENPGDVGMTG